MHLTPLISEMLKYELKKKGYILELERLVKSLQFFLLPRGQGGLPSTVAEKGEVWDKSYDPILG